VLSYEDDAMAVVAVDCLKDSKESKSTHGTPPKKEPKVKKKKTTLDQIDPPKKSHKPTSIASRLDLGTSSPHPSFSSFHFSLSPPSPFSIL
jgi:hypothetical protein